MDRSDRRNIAAPLIGARAIVAGSGRARRRDRSRCLPGALAEWSDTRDTLHLWTQVVGKVRLASEPLVNHWWNVPLYVSARGLGTSLVHHPTGPSFQIDLDLLSSVLRTSTVDGTSATTPRWVHPRVCTACGHVGCCDSSPNRHATAHFHQHPDHPLVRSYEPGEDWWWCYVDEALFTVPGAPPAPSHP